MVDEPRWNAITKPESYADRLTEKERIEFIREYGTETMKDGMKSVFDGNKWKPKRKEMWKRDDGLDKGRRMVQTIIEKRIGEHIS